MVFSLTPPSHDQNPGQAPFPCLLKPFQRYLKGQPYLPPKTSIMWVIGFLKIYLFSATLGLHCCMQAFSSCSKWGLLSSCCAQASHCGGFSCCRAQALGVMGSVAVVLWHMESFQIRDGTRVPCIGRRILNHWTIRKIRLSLYVVFFFFCPHRVACRILVP